MNRREDHHEAIKIKGGFTESLAQVTQDSIPGSKFDNDQVNHSLGTIKELNESTRKLDVSFCSLIKLVFVVVAII